MSTSTLLSQPHQEGIKKTPLSLPRRPQTFRTKYNSLPVPVTLDFLTPLPTSSLPQVSVEKLDFANSALPEYKHHIAIIIDGLFDEKECKELIHYAEMSAGGHGHGNGSSGNIATFQPLRSKNDREGEIQHEANKENGWHQALVRTGANRESLSLAHRNSDRIIWSSQEVASGIWERLMQAPGMREEMAVLEGESSRVVMGEGAVEREERWSVSKRGINESLKFLRYAGGQYFREHCDGTYETPDGSERSFFTIHLYLNDSVQMTRSKTVEDDLISLDIDEPEIATGSGNPGNEMLEGGATTFHSRDMRFKIDVDPKVGRVLIFQQKALLHSGADVVKGVKYTMRSDIMYEFDGEEKDEGDIVFG